MTTAYLERQANRENECSKQPCRDRVGAYLLSHHEWRTMKLLSLPSATWCFERQIQACLPNARFMAVERDLLTIHRGIPWMPGTNPRWFTDELKTQNVHGLRNDKSTILHIDLATWARIGRAQLGARGRRRDWRTKYEKITAIWLDFTSPICQQIEAALPTIGGACDWNVKSVPIAITFMGAREHDDVTDKIAAFDSCGCGRAEYVSRLLDSSRFRKFELDESFEYTSDSSTPMLTIMGRLVMRWNRSEEMPDIRVRQMPEVAHA